MDYILDTSAAEIDNTPAEGVELTEIHDLQAKRKWFLQFLHAMHEDATSDDPERYANIWKYLEASCDGEAVGFIRLRDESSEFENVYDGEVWSIWDAYVLPEYRHQGIFRNMIKMAIVDFNVKIILNEESIFKTHVKFYSSLGFTLSRVIIDEIDWNQCWSFHSSIREAAAELMGMPGFCINQVIADDDGNPMPDQKAAWKEARRISAAHREGLE